MTLQTLEDAITLAGGAATEESCPKVIPVDQFHEICMSAASVGMHFHNILGTAGREDMGAIVLTQSPAFAAKVKPVQGGFALLVPLGMPARVRVLARLLLRYWGKEHGARVFRSILDDMPGDADAIPPLLKPILLEDFEPESFWDRLGELDESIEVDPRVEPDVRELVHLALVFLLSHEFTHVLHGHFELLERVASEDLGLSRSEIRRGLEVDADDGASAISMRILKEDVERALTEGRPSQLELGWLRLAYVVTMLFAITDSHRKFLGAYDAGNYNHPIVRCELFIQGATRSLDGPEAVKQAWVANSSEGWKRCVLALDDLTLDAMGGAFGKLPKGTQGAPLHTLQYSITPLGITDRVMLSRVRQAAELKNRVRALLPIFQDAGSAG